MDCRSSGRELLVGPFVGTLQEPGPVGQLWFGQADGRQGLLPTLPENFRAEGGKRGALLLNHLTAPHVLIRSAVHASCCLPNRAKPTARPSWTR